MTRITQSNHRSLAALCGLALLILAGWPGAADAQAYRSLLGQGWTYVEAGNFRKAEEAFKEAFATPEGKNAAEVYYAIAALWWERRNAMASYMWLSDAEKASRGSFNWDGGPDGEWDQRIEQRRTYIQRNFGAVRLRSPSRGAPLPPLADPTPTDPLLQEFTDSLPRVIEEGVAEKVAVQWVLLPAGEYWVGDDLKVLGAGQLDAAKAPAWELPKDGGKIRKAYEARVAAIERGESPAAAEREAVAVAAAAADAASKAEAERLEAEQAAAAAERAAAKAEADRAAKAEAERVAAAEADRAAKAEAERLAKIEADRAAKAEAERLAKVEAERAAKAEADRAAKAEAERVAAAERAAEAERLAKAEAARAAKAEAERAAKAEAERLAQIEADRVAKAEAERAAKAAAERGAKEEAERLAKAEAERAAKAEADRIAKAEADRAAKAEAERAAKAEAERAAKAESERAAEAERLAAAEKTDQERQERAAKAEAEARSAERAAAEKAQREQDRKDREWEEAQARMRADQEREKQAEALRREQLREQRAGTPTSSDPVFETRRLALSTAAGGSTVTKMAADSSSVGLDWNAQLRVDYIAPLKGATVALPIGLSWSNLPVNGCSHRQTRANALALHVGPRFAAPLKGRLWFAGQIGAHFGGGASFPTSAAINQCATDSLKPESDGVAYGARLKATDGSRARLSLGDLGWSGWALMVGPDADVGILGAPGSGASYLGVSFFMRYDHVLPVISGTAYQFKPEGSTSPDLSSVTLETVSGQASMARFQFGLRARILF